MSTFSPTDAALEGVRISRERPRAMFLWALWFFLFWVFLIVTAALVLGERRSELIDISHQSPADFDRSLEHLWPFVAIGYPLWLFFQVAFTAAVYRCVLGAHEEKRLYLTIGRDELRLFLLSLINSAIVAGFLFVGFFVVLIAGVGSGQLADLMGMLALLALIGAGAYVWVRLSLAGPATCAQGRLVVFEAWRITKGHFWRLLGTYALGFFIAAIVFFVMLIAFVVALGVLLGVTHLRTADLGVFPPRPKAMILWLLAQVSASLIIVCWRMIVYAPGAEAYKELAGSA